MTERSRACARSFLRASDFLRYLEFVIRRSIAAGAVRSSNACRAVCHFESTVSPFRSDATGANNAPAPCRFEPSESARKDGRHPQAGMVCAIEQTADDDHRATVNGPSQAALAIDVRREKSLHAFWIPQNRPQARAHLDGATSGPRTVPVRICLAVAVVALRQPRRVQRRNGPHGPIGLREAFAPLDAALLVAARGVLPR